jgi:hypothetical protein
MATLQEELTGRVKPGSRNIVSLGGAEGWHAE